MIDPNWTRWIVASLTVAFTARTAPLPLFIEGTDRRTAPLSDYAELRHDGPRFREASRGYWLVEVEVDVLLVSKLNDQNIYTFEAGIGAVAAAFTADIPVYRYGDGPNDSPLTLLGCLVLNPRPDGPVTVTNFGKVLADARLRQASVAACYRMELSTP